MSETESSSPSWRIPLLLTVGVVVAVIIALLMAHLDTSQRRSLLPPKSLPVVDTEATVVAEDLPRVYLPSDFGATPTPSTTPSSETTTLDQSWATANAGVKPACTTGRADWTPYTIQDKESLAILANRFGISEHDILQANCLAQEKLVEGDQIFLPPPLTPNSLPLWATPNATP